MSHLATIHPQMSSSSSSSSSSSPSGSSSSGSSSGSSGFSSITTGYQSSISSSSSISTPPTENEQELEDGIDEIVGKDNKERRGSSSSSSSIDYSNPLDVDRATKEYHAAVAQWTSRTWQAVRFVIEQRSRHPAYRHHHDTPISIPVLPSASASPSTTSTSNSRHHNSNPPFSTGPLRTKSQIQQQQASALSGISNLSALFSAATMLSSSSSVNGGSNHNDTRDELITPKAC